MEASLDDIAQLKRIVETALLTSTEPLSVPIWAGFWVASSAGHGPAAPGRLARRLGGKGVELVAVASGWRFQARPEFRSTWIESSPAENLQSIRVQY